MKTPDLIVMLTTPASGPIDPDALLYALHPWVWGALFGFVVCFVLGFWARGFVRR